MNHRKIAALIANLVLALALAITALPAQAAVPQTLNYQGQLASAGGVPVNGTVNITFSLYDVATGGTALWSETQSVTVTNGLYSVTLGQMTPLDATLFTAQRYLGITVGTDPEMTPRIALSSSATALTAADATMLGGRASNAYALVTDVASTYVTAAALASQLSSINTQVGTLGTQVTSINTQVAALGTQVTQLQAAQLTSVQPPQGNTLTAVDTVGGVGQYTSLSIGADGLPVISYYDITNVDLKVAKCANAFCVPYFRRR